MRFNYKTTMEKDGRHSTRTWFSHLEHAKHCKKSEKNCKETLITWLIDLVNKFYDIEKFCI